MPKARIFQGHRPLSSWEADPGLSVWQERQWLCEWVPLQNHSLQRLKTLSLLEKRHIQAPCKRDTKWEAHKAVCPSRQFQSWLFDFQNLMKLLERKGFWLSAKTGFLQAQMINTHLSLSVTERKRGPGVQMCAWDAGALQIFIGWSDHPNHPNFSHDREQRRCPRPFSAKMFGYTGLFSRERSFLKCLERRAVLSLSHWHRLRVVHWCPPCRSELWDSGVLRMVLCDTALVPHSPLH